MDSYRVNRTPPMYFTWLPEAPGAAVREVEHLLEAETPAGMRLALREGTCEGARLFEGELRGAPAPPSKPIPAADALARDCQAGGIVLLRVAMALPEADAYQRPRWSDGCTTVEILPLDPRLAAVRVGETIELRWYPPYRGASAVQPLAFAILIAPVEDFTERWRALAAARGVPGAHRPADRARVKAVASQPTLFVLGPMHTRNADRLLSWAAEHGFGSLLLHCPLWSASDATYAPNLTNWPRGWDDLRAFGDQVRAHGLTLGLHTMTTSIADHDPLVTPVPDPRLLSVWSSTLRRAVDAEATTLTLDDPLDGLSRRHDYMSYGRVVQLGDELIQYTAIDEASNALTGCLRGAYGTQAAAHRRGSPARYLFRLYHEFAVDPESDLVEEVGANLARAFQATGAEMIYFDDSEAVPDPYAAHISRYHARLWQCIGIPHLHVQASSTGAYGQYLLARVGQQDTTIYKRATLDGAILPLAPRYKAGDLTPDFGWFGIVEGAPDRDFTHDDDIDVLMARVIGCQAGVTVFASPEMTGGALFTRVARRIAAWRKAEIPTEVAPRLAVPGAEFRPCPEGDRVIVREVAPRRQHLHADEHGVLTLPLAYAGPARPMSLRFTLLPPADAPASPENLQLYHPERDTITPMTPTASITQQAWRWHITDPAQDYARWQLIFPTPLDLTAHRVPAARFRVEGEAEHFFFRLLNGLADWPIGAEYHLPFTAGTDTVAYDPQPDPMLHQQGRWPDNWYAFALGVNFACVEAVEIVGVGLRGTGQLTVESLEACRERRPAGPWSPSIATDHSLHPGHPLGFDGTLELHPTPHGVRADIFTPSGALEWTWEYDLAEAPWLQSGENTLTITGLPSRARINIRIDM